MKTCPYCAEEIQDAAIVCKHCGRDLAPQPNRTQARSSAPTLRTIALVIIGVLAIAWLVNNRAVLQRAAAVATSAPITLKDEVENVPAAAWKGVALTLPYTGTLDVSLSVARGNSLDVFLTTPDQVDAMNRNDWSSVRIFSDFSATKTRLFERSAHLAQGNYYLVLRDTSLGILSSSASDVRLSVKLHP